MITKLITDYAELEEKFGELTPEAERRLRVRVSTLLKEDALKYIKYQILKKAVNRIDRAKHGDGKGYNDLITTAYLPELLANSLVEKEIPKRESHFRAKN